MNEDKIVLDKASFKALSSDVRVEIIKLLDRRRYTVSELSRVLDQNKSSLLEHLDKLVEAGIVKKIDDSEHKWVYYALTFKGRSILHPEHLKIALVLSIAFLLFSLSAFLIIIGAIGYTEPANTAISKQNDDSRNSLPPGGTETGSFSEPGNESNGNRHYIRTDWIIAGIFVVIIGTIMVLLAQTIYKRRV